MARIIIAAPCQNIHRFLLPPNSTHVMSHSFAGGGIVLATMLHHLLVQWDEKNEFEPWHDKLKKKKGGLPDRYLRLAPYAAAPALKKHLKPDTLFLRVEEKEDADCYYHQAHGPFEVSPGTATQNTVFLVGGEEPEETWNLIKNKDDKKEDDKNEDDKAAVTGKDIVYVLAKSGMMIENHCRHLRHNIKPSGGMPKIIGQIDVDDLAKEYPLQTDTSYERTVGEICRAVMFPPEEPGKAPVSTISAAEHKPQKQKELLPSLLGKEGLDHLIIRIGNAACLVVTPPKSAVSTGNGQSTSKATARKHGPYEMTLYCHPDRCAPTTFPGLGSMLAYDLLLCAAVVRQLAQDAPGQHCFGSLEKGASIGVQATYRCFIEGFGIFDPDLKDDAKRKQIEVNPALLFAGFVRHGMQVQAEAAAKELAEAAAKAHAEAGADKNTQAEAKALADSTGAQHSVLRYPQKAPPADWPAVYEPAAEGVLTFPVHYETANSPNKFWRMVVPEKENEGTSEQCCLQKARGHLLHKAALPLVKLGDLKLVDRQEVEDYLFLQRLLLGYHEDHSMKRPLCIGVFGQPGAGKSYGVNQLVSEMSGDSETFSKKSISINLSQLRSFKELADSFHLIRDACLQRPIPLVFFDEFDSSFEGRTFGWLKYFLAPMQDGEFTYESKKYSFGKAIFVFAGGVNHSFAEFNERTRNPEFCDAKGPDFISRLRGILNICGMNKPDGETVEHLYMIRRAVFLRSLLAKRMGKSVEKLIEPSLANAFLTIPRFKHGVRSLQAILEMSTFKPGRTFSHSSLPPRDQLDMHVDAREFLRLAGVLTPLSNR